MVYSTRLAWHTEALVLSPILSKNEKRGLGEGGKKAGERAGRQSGSPALSIQTCCVRTMVATKLQIDMEGQLPVRGRGAGGSMWTT